MEVKSTKVKELDDAKFWIACDSACLTSANCRAHYQWLALQPQAPHTLHQQQVRQAAQHWVQSHWLRQEHKQEQKHGLKHGQKPNLVWSYWGPYALLAAAFCNIGVDATAPDMLDAEGWAAVLQLYGADLLTQRNIAANTQANPTASHPYAGERN